VVCCRVFDKLGCARGEESLWNTAVDSEPPCASSSSVLAKDMPL
jgi:hypothetical protein